MGAAHRVSGVGSVDFMVGQVFLRTSIVAPSPIFSVTSIISRDVVSLVSVYVGLVHWFSAGGKGHVARVKCRIDVVECVLFILGAKTP